MQAGHHSDENRADVGLIPSVQSSLDDLIDTIGNHFVTFGVADQWYALPLTQVERVVRMVALIPVPEAAEWIAGMLNLQGSVLPVISLRRRLGLPPVAVSIDHRILVMNAANRRFGLIAEAVEDVIAVDPDQFTPPSGGIAQSSLLTAVIDQGERVYLVLAADRIDPAPVTSSLSTTPKDGFLNDE